APTASDNPERRRAMLRSTPPLRQTPLQLPHNSSIASPYRSSFVVGRSIFPQRHFSRLMPDPTLAVMLFQDRTHAVECGGGLRRIEILDGRALVIPIRLGMDCVAGQHDRSGFGQFHEQTLMAWRMPRRSNEPNAAVAKHVMVALGLPNRLTGREP